MLWSTSVSATSDGGPLADLRVVEFGQLIAGPLVGTMLGDFGAEVIKVEPPAGDQMRDWGQVRHRGRTLWWSVLARNKRSVALDLKDPEAAELAFELCREADVVVENFRPGAMERWGLGPDTVTDANPRCVYARISGYGQRSRYRDRPGFASGGEALSGLRYVNGYPGQAPPRAGISLGDTLAAWSAFQGILLALHAREASGQGQVVDAAILDACLAVTESMIPDYALGGVVREPSGSRLPRIAPSNVYRSADGRWVVIAANHDTLWRRLAAAMGRPELGEDPRYATHAARGEREDELDELIGAWAAQHGAAELDQILGAAGVVCAPVNTAAEILADPHFRERGLIVDVEDPHHGTMPAPGVVPQLSRTPGSIRRPAPDQAGADTLAVLGELGVADERVRELAGRGVIVTPAGETAPRDGADPDSASRADRRATRP
jgi:crotonobetainyl-CoA:carnitine CoA-transferase CaiB-like acyl-CoA transferase